MPKSYHLIEYQQISRAKEIGGKREGKTGLHSRANIKGILMSLKDITLLLTEEILYHKQTGEFVSRIF